MIEKIISFSLRNKLLILSITAGLFAWGIYSMLQNAVDAIPDLSENQVIVFTEWQGRSPQIIEDQVTYPLLSNLQGIPHLKTIRGTSMFGMSFVFVIFDDNVDVYWARTRVLERLNYAQRLLPQEVTPTLGPDGTGVGQIFWYTLDSRTMDLGELRALQDWYVRYALQTVPGVSEVASFGGFQKQFQVTVDPRKLNYYDIPLTQVISALRANNNDAGGSKLEANDRAFIVRGLGYFHSIEDIENTTVSTINTIPVKIKDVATVQVGGESRLGIFDQNGEGETVGGMVVMRYGQNADAVIKNVKAKMSDVQKGLPKGVTFHVAYDRSTLIEAAINSVKDTLIEELIVVSIIVILFLFHWRSAAVILIQLPVSVGISFIMLQLLHVSSNIMSLTGLALAIGVIVDAGIVMVENTYRHLADEPAGFDKKRRWEIIELASHQVGRAIFLSTIIIVVSFLPVFLLTGQEYKLFSPLAFTKTFVLLGSAVLSITLVPVLMIFFMKGKFKQEDKFPVPRFFNAVYKPVLGWALKHKNVTLSINVAALLIAVPLFINLGSEFMPPLDEGSILYMPVTLPDVSNSEAKRLLVVQDKIIKSVPEVENVLGKAGRVNSATDNSPINMTETLIQLKPKSKWRKGVTKEGIVNELNSKLQIPGITNGWTQPIINRINMLSTGIRTDVGVKIYGQNLDSIYLLATLVKRELENVKGIKDLYVEPITGGKYLEIKINRDEIGRYGLTEGDMNEYIESALGGSPVTTMIDGRRRFSISVRFAQDFRNDPDAIKRLQIQTMNYGPVPLTVLADVKLTDGPPMINSENSLLLGTVLFNVRDRDLGSTVKDAQSKLNTMQKQLPKGYYIQWSGQWENQIRAQQNMRIILPLVLITIFLLLVFIYRSVKEALVTSLSVPFALIGGVFLVYFYGVNLSVAVAVGFIALLGVAVETGVLMVIYLDEALTRKAKSKGESLTRQDIHDAVVEGSLKRLRPKLMTVGTALIGLLPILWSTGTGTDVMRPIALPMIGGLLTSTIHVLIVTPIIFLITKEIEFKKTGRVKILNVKH